MPRPLKPELEQAVAGQKAKASTYNSNFDKMINYVEDNTNYNISEFDNLVKYRDVTPLTFASEIILADASIHKVDITENTAFLLPTITADEKFHQILVQIAMPEVKTIALGTTHFYNEEAPDMSEIGSYDLIYEHNGTDWVVGAIKRN